LSQLSTLNKQLDISQAKDHFQQKEVMRFRTIENDYHYYRTLSDTKESEILKMINEKKNIEIKLEDTISSYNQYKHETKEQLEDMEAQVVVKQNENNLLNAKCETLNEEFNAIKQELNDIVTEYTLLKDKITQMNEKTAKEKADDVKRILKLEAQVREMGEQVDDLNLLNNRLQNDIKNLSDSSSQLKNDCQAKYKTIYELRDLIRNKQQENQLFNQTNSNMDNTIENYRGDLTKILQPLSLNVLFM
jgi:chromosome segregation ATPase